MGTKQANVVDTVQALLDRLDVSATKKAEALSEPGGYSGSSTHPVTKVDDRLQEASEGSRSSENTEDVKADLGEPSVDSTTPGTPGGQNSVTLDVGITSKATGEDPSAETDSAKGGKEDPGSSHPARTDNDAIDGKKYANVFEEFDALCKQAQELGNDLMASITVAVQKPEEKRAQEDRAAGQAAAEIASDEGLDKQAIDALVVQSIAETVKTAEQMADLTAEYLNAYFQTLQKQANEGGEQLAGPAELMAGAGGEAGDQVIDPETLAAMTEGGAGGELGGAELGGEGLPPEAGLDAGAAGEEGISDEDTLMLAQILEEAGVSPEELEAALVEGEGGAPADDAGGVPPEALAAGGEVPVEEKISYWRPKTAADRAKYARAKKHVIELIAANRR